MMIERYFAREIFLSTLAIVSVLLLIGISNQFVRYLADAAQGEIAATLVFKVVAMHLPSLLGLLLPLGLYFGIVMALSRLWADSEMTALLACGMPYSSLIRAIVIPGVVVMLISAVLNFWLAPHYLLEVSKTLAQAETDLISRAITPGRFQTSDDGKYVLYIDELTGDGKVAEDVFIAEQELNVDGSFELGVIASHSGKQWRDPESNDDYIVLENGNRYQGTPGEAKYQIMSFREYGLRILEREAKFRLRENAMSSLDLLTATKRDEQAELQWRLAITVSTVVLALFALSVSRVRPRQGKYAKALPAIIIAIVYINILIFARGFYEDNDFVPQWVGLYWVLVAGFVAAILTLYRQSRAV